MIDGDVVVGPAPALQVEVFDDALVIWDVDKEKLHHLDGIASTVWGEFDGDRTLDAISEVLAGRYSTERRQIQQDVVALVERLLDEGLVVPVGDRP